MTSPSLSEHNQRLQPQRSVLIQPNYIEALIIKTQSSGDYAVREGKTVRGIVVRCAVVVCIANRLVKCTWWPRGHRRIKRSDRCELSLKITDAGDWLTGIHNTIDHAGVHAINTYCSKYSNNKKQQQQTQSCELKIHGTCPDDTAKVARSPPYSVTATRPSSALCRVVIVAVHHFPYRKRAYGPTCMIHIPNSSLGMLPYTTWVTSLTLVALVVHHVRVHSSTSTLSHTAREGIIHNIAQSITHHAPVATIARSIRLLLFRL